MKNKMLQRIINIALAVTLVVGIVPANAMADEIEADTAIEYAEETDVEEDVEAEATAVKSVKIGKYTRVSQTDVFMLPNSKNIWYVYESRIMDMKYDAIGITEKDKKTFSKKYLKHISEAADWISNAQIVKVKVINPDEYIDVWVNSDKKSWGYKTWESDNYAKRSYVVHTTYKYKGKKYTFKSKIGVVTEKPFASIKINNKDVTSKVKWVELNWNKGATNKNYHLDWKLKKGYKLVDVYYTTWKKGSSVGSPWKYYRKGSNIKMKSNLREIGWWFKIQNSKGQQFDYFVNASLPTSTVQ